MTEPAIPQPVADAFSRHPAPIRARLLEIRALIFAEAAATQGVGPLTEVLKWGEPAYLTEASKSGSTIRLGVVSAAPDDCAVLFNCKTSLIDSFRSRFGDTFRFDGNRALLVEATGPLPQGPLGLCLRAALTYHCRKGGAVW